MKKIKALLAAVLCVTVLLGTASMPASASEPYPESEHFYANNFYGEWEYDYGKDTEGLYITFSKDTYTELGDVYYEIVFDPENGEVDVKDVIEEGYSHKVGDFISVFDSDENLIGVYQGGKLGGMTIYVPGRSFKITLTTDSTVTGYGFKIDSVSETIPDGVGVVRVHLPGGKIEYKPVLCNQGNEAEWGYSDYAYKMYSGEAVIGWKYPDGSEYYYKGWGGSLYSFEVTESKLYDVYAITTPVALNPEDVYSFANSDEYFNVNDENNYYMTKEDHLRLLASVCITGATIPLALPAAITSVVLLAYPNFNWAGSCIGFANTVCLQKAGILDVVSTQEGATCVSDLLPTEDLISLLNYYNAQSAGGFLPKNKALIPNTKEYTRQLKKLYESAEKGNVILFEFFPVGTQDIFELYHGFSISGAYTRPDGVHVILYYDNNAPEYATQGIAEAMYISPDFSEIDITWYCAPGEAAFVWMDDFECYKSLDINNEYSPIHFHISLIKHIFEVLWEWITTYIFGVFKKN